MANTHTMIRKEFSNGNFQVVINRIPNVTYDCKTISIPGMTLEGIQQPSPLKVIWVEGNNLSYEDLTLTMILDEDLYSYRMFKKWVEGLSFPDSVEEFIEISKSTEPSLKSDITINITTNNSTKNLQLFFKGCFPVNIGGFELSTDDENPVTFSVTFRFTSYAVEVVT